MRSSPERRRLRFSFQINDVKDPTGVPAPPFSARWSARSGVLVAPFFRVNRSFSLYFPERSGNLLKAKTKPLERRGVPLSRSSESIEAAVSSDWSLGKQAICLRSFSAAAVAVLSGGGVLVASKTSVNRPFCLCFPETSGSQIQAAKRVRKAAEASPFTSSSRRLRLGRLATETVEIKRFVFAFSPPRRSRPQREAAFRRGFPAWQSPISII